MGFIPLLHRPPRIVNTNPLCCGHPHPDLLLGLVIVILLHHEATSLLANLVYKLVEIQQIISPLTHIVQLK